MFNSSVFLSRNLNKLKPHVTYLNETCMDIAELTINFDKDHILMCNKP